jgi:hypothetical protein
MTRNQYILLGYLTKYIKVGIIFWNLFSLTFPALLHPFIMSEDLGRLSLSQQEFTEKSKVQFLTHVYMSI